MRTLARKKGGRCISTFYVNSAAPLLWECKADHQCNAVPASIRKGTWCPECAGVRPATIGQMQQIARSRGGRCLSERSCNTATKLSWRCSGGHQWSATPFQVKKGHYCPFCAGVAPVTLPALQYMAAQKGGASRASMRTHPSRFGGNAQRAMNDKSAETTERDMQRAVYPPCTPLPQFERIGRI
jgi:hypothetical protein